MMYAFAALAVVALVAAMVIQTYRVIIGYTLSTGTPWQRFLAAFSHSHTILLARAGTFLAALAAAFESWLPTLDPSSQIGTAVTSLLNPKFTPWYFLAFSVAVEYMRRRRASIDPILPPPQAVVIPPTPVLDPPTLPSGAPNPVAQ